MLQRSKDKPQLHQEVPKKAMEKDYVKIIKYFFTIIVF